MTDAHLHIAINHFPIVGIFFGFGILIAGLFRRNLAIKQTAYIVFIISAITAFTSMATGEGAEEMVEHMPDITKHIIHEHEEIAEKLALVLYVIGALSIAGLFLKRQDSKAAKFVAYSAMVLSAIGLWLALASGTSGGEIRHTEIRTDYDAHDPKHLE
ncbi:DUF2231 domain-containing protein [Flavobacterium sp. 3HN19-14]|uniref:DUF2231 domain-containing protein n=1 Tax=Flavobacterium sp. 3HN19-14 TaxID=3448133 RepID=UPI003EE31939